MLGGRRDSHAGVAGRGGAAGRDRLGVTESDIFLEAGDAVIVRIDRDGGSNGNFQVWSPAVVFDVDEIGNVKVNGALVHSSDRDRKENLAAVESASILEAVATLPIQRWNFIDDEEETLHLGPMAQDFYAAFGLGTDERHIATVDADGVALAAIQGLHQLVRRQQGLIRQLQDRLGALEGR